MKDFLAGSLIGMEFLKVLQLMMKRGHDMGLVNSFYLFDSKSGSYEKIGIMSPSGSMFYASWF